MTDTTGAALREPAQSATRKAPKKGTAPRSAKKKNSKSVHSKWISDLRYGQSLSIEFFSQNAWLLIILLVAVLSLIGLRYKTKTKMAEIKSLTHQLELAESAKLQEKAAYMSLVRETEMRRLVNEKHLGLVFQEQPPFEVEAVKE
jgi:preprotein translocase subunit SecF